MSDLEAVCDALSAINGDIMQMAQALHSKAQVYNRVAANAAVAARSAEGGAIAALARTATALNVAAQHCGRAAQALVGASQEGQAFVHRTVGGGGAGDRQGFGSGAGEPTATWPGTRFGLEQSSTASGGINLLPANDAAGQMASELPSEPGFTDVVIHGNQYEFGAHDGPGMTASDLGDVIEATPQLAGKPIRLLSCNTGELHNGAAQQLANRIGQPVMAPNDFVNLVGRPGRVRMVVGPNPFTKSGTWHTFMPEGNGANA